MANRTFVLTGPGMGLPGLDGDLHGLVPERQPISDSAHITVDGVNVSVSRSWTARDGAVLPIGTVIADSKSKAITVAAKQARYVWDTLNPGADLPVINDEAGRLEGEVVVIDFMSDNYTGQALKVNIDSQSSGINMFWRDTDGTKRVIRDICFRGKGPLRTDVVFPSIQVEGQTGAGAGQADNWRFENLHMEASENTKSPFVVTTSYAEEWGDHPLRDSGQGAMFYQANRSADPSRGFFGSVWWNKLNDDYFVKENATTPVWVSKGKFLDRFQGNYQGVFKFYDCLHTGGNYSGNNFNGTGCEWSAVRSAGRCTGFDFRGAHYGAANQHCCYISTPQGFFYDVDGTQVITPALGTDGTGHTTFQFDARPISNPGPPGYGSMVFIRTEVQGNVLDITTAKGGYDWTIWGGFDGTVYVIDCSAIGSADSPDPAKARGIFNIAIEKGFNGIGTVQNPKGATAIEMTDGSDTWATLRTLDVRNFTVNTFGNKRKVIQLQGVGLVKWGSTHLQNDLFGSDGQIRVSNDGGGATIDYLPCIDWVWQGDHLPTASASPPFLAGGTEVNKMVINHRSDFGIVETLTDIQIDAFDGSDPV